MRAFRLDVRAGWRTEPALTSDVTVTDALRLRSPADDPRPLADAWGSFGGLADPTGAAADADGRVYLVDAALPGVRRWDDCTGAWEPLPCLGGEGAAPRQLSAPVGLVVTPRGDLVVADTGNARLQVVALKGLVLRRVVGRPAGVESWHPYDLAVLPGHTSGCAWRLAVSDPVAGVVHVLGADFRLLATWGPFAQPEHLAADRAGRLHVTERGSATVRVLDLDGAQVATATTTDGLADAFGPVSVVVLGDGTRVPAWTVPAPERPVVRAGVFVAGPLDSRLPGCEWHRVALDADVPTGTSVTVHAVTTEGEPTPAEVALLPETRWRGGQVHGGGAGWDCLVLAPPGRRLWLRLTLAGDGRATPEVRAVRVDLPRVTSARFLPAVYRDEPTSADFLGRLLSVLDATKESVDARIGGVPRLFDPMATPAGGGEPDFLGWLAAWLGLAADARVPLDRRRRLVAEAHRLFAWRGTPRGIRLHAEIVTGRPVRLLEEHTLRKWLWAGSGRVGESALWGADVVRRLQLDGGRRLGEGALVGATDPLRDPFHVHAHRFTLVVAGTGDAERDAELRALAERAVELAKPAHTEGRVHVLAARLRVGVQAFVGVDTVVAAYPTETRTGTGSLGSDTVLGGSATGRGSPGMRVGDTARIGTTTVLD